MTNNKTTNILVGRLHEVDQTVILDFFDQSLDKEWPMLILPMELETNIIAIKNDKS